MLSPQGALPQGTPHPTMHVHILMLCLPVGSVPQAGASGQAVGMPMPAEGEDRGGPPAGVPRREEGLKPGPCALLGQTFRNLKWFPVCFEQGYLIELSGMMEMSHDQHCPFNTMAVSHMWLVNT